MAKLWAVIKREYVERVRSKWFLISTLLGPVFLGAIIIIPTFIAAKSRAGSAISDTVILDVTKNGFGGRLADVIAGGPAGRGKTINPAMISGARPTVRAIDPSALPQAESLATREVMRKEHDGYVVVDQRTVDGEAVRYAGKSATSIPDMERLERAVKETVLSMRLEAAGIDAAK